MTVVVDQLGGRTVYLFIPFSFNGTKIDKIEFSAFCYDHSIRWKEGHYKSLLGLMADMSHQSETVLRQLRAVDTDRVMTEFFAMMPPEIREDIERGTIPQRVDAPPVPVTESAPSGQEPRVLAPDYVDERAGFDLTDG